MRMDNEKIILTDKVILCPKTTPNNSKTISTSRIPQKRGAVK